MVRSARRLAAVCAQASKRWRVTIVSTRTVAASSRSCTATAAALLSAHVANAAAAYRQRHRCSTTVASCERRSAVPRASVQLRHTAATSRTARRLDMRWQSCRAWIWLCSTSCQCTSAPRALCHSHILIALASSTRLRRDSSSAVCHLLNACHTARADHLTTARRMMVRRR
jgi:hypothetical protein